MNDSNSLEEESHLSLNISSLAEDSGLGSDVEVESILSEDYLNESDEGSETGSAKSPFARNDSGVQDNGSIHAELVGKLVSFINQRYPKAIRNMCSENLESIEIDYLELKDFYDEIDENSEVFLETLQEALTKSTLQYFPNYNLIKPMIHPRIVNIPVIEELRGLRNCHLNKLIRIHGVVTRRSGIFSLYNIVKYTCLKCRCTFGPFVGKDLGKTYPSNCFECQSRGPFVVNSAETIYKDFQKITVQEIPGTVPSGALPRSKEVLLYFDLIDSCKPGDEVDIVGIYKNNFSLRLNIKNGFPVFSTVIECSSLTKKQLTKCEITEDDVREIRELAKKPNIRDILINSVAPSIYGHKNIKICILLSMLSGVPKERSGMKIRGDINVLLMGDPGTAKSQFLRFVHQTSHRAVLATGQGSSSVGLTASVRRDPVLKEWTLEGGALVLADSGICCIDEFDKMNEHDRTSIHEAMEQQSISISKAGIVASLHARCAILAAANPVRGKYNPSLSFAQNINLSDPIISRFDLLCVVKDVIDEAEDTRMAKFILNSHQKDVSGNSDVGSIDQTLLKKYLLFARNNCHPKIPEFETGKISQLYFDLRKESMHSGIPITVRHIESIVRIAEAFAKMRLSNVVSKADVDQSIAVTLQSFLSAQKYSITKQLKKKFSKYFEENNDDLLVYILKKMFNEVTDLHLNCVSKVDFVNRCKFSEINLSEGFFSSERFDYEGFVLRDGNILRKRINY